MCFISHTQVRETIPWDNRYIHLYYHSSNPISRFVSRSSNNSISLDSLYPYNLSHNDGIIIQSKIKRYNTNLICQVIDARAVGNWIAQEFVTWASVRRILPTSTTEKGKVSKEIRAAIEKMNLAKKNDTI